MTSGDLLGQLHVPHGASQAVHPPNHHHSVFRPSGRDESRATRPEARHDFAERARSSNRRSPPEARPGCAGRCPAWPCELAEDVEAALEKRIARQASVFDRQKPPHIFVILNWVALAQPVGGNEIMRGQLGHPLQVGELPNVSIRVLERDAGEHCGLDGSFALLKDPRGPKIALDASGWRSLVAGIKDGRHDFA
ncbi:Scr1 family TA system antitoxin-like transcriptional regulator [Spirillospora sp. NPDC048911]|uniref:Scr1 family TA system antitoxin-like transcriptional regulator n=1 Tax=Spirillospora sp. NPDC048911 TaxID=3364527 RepID=UPI003715743D